MRLIILYHPQSDHIGLVDTYAQDFRRFKGRNIERLSLETKEGAEMAALYDIVRYPALLAIGPDGALAAVWQGTLLPLMDELSAYAGEPEELISHEGRKIVAPSPILTHA